MAKKAPIGLEAGDEFETPFGDIEIQGVDRSKDEFDIYDPDTGEETTLRQDDLISIMQGNLQK